MDGSAKPSRSRGRSVSVKSASAPSAAPAVEADAGIGEQELVVAAPVSLIAPSAKRVTRSSMAAGPKPSALTAASQKLDLPPAAKRVRSNQAQAQPSLAPVGSADVVPSADTENSVTIVDDKSVTQPVEGTDAAAAQQPELSTAQWATKLGVTLTGDPFEDDKLVGAARAAMDPPDVKIHRTEKSAVAPRRAAKPRKDDETVTRLKTLTPLEKKAAAALRVVVCLLGKEMVLRTNRIPQLCADIVSTLEPFVVSTAASDTSVGASDAASGGTVDAPVDDFAQCTASFIPLPQADLPSVMGAVIDATRKAAADFAADPDNQYEVDDEMLSILAHAACRAINHIEGFLPPPDYVPSSKAKAARLLAINKAKEKVVKAAEKQALKQKEELEKQRLKLAEELQAKAAKGMGIEDTDLQHASSIVGVATAPLPLLTVELFETALHVWSIVVSAPKLLKLSQMPFATFLQGLKDNSSTGTIMRDVLRGMVQASGAGDIAEGRTTTAKSWLGACLTFMTDRMNAIVEAAGMALSTAKKRPTKVKKPKTAASTGGRGLGRHHRSDSDDDDDSDEESDTESDEDSDATSSASNTNVDDDDGAAVAADAQGDGVNIIMVKKPRPETPMQAARRKAEEGLVQLRAIVDKYTPARMCSWINLEVTERLAVLRFVCGVMLQTEAFAAHMAAVEQRTRQEIAKFDVKAKQLRDDAEKAKRAARAQQREADAGIGKGKPRAGKQKTRDAVDGDEPQPPAQLQEPTAPLPKLLSESDFAAKLKAIDDKAERAVESAFLALRSKLEKDDIGLRIRPLGRDRHRRIVWYLPQDRRLLLQSVPGVSDPSIIAPSSSAVTHGGLVDDEQLAGRPSVRRVDLWGTPALTTPATAKPHRLIDDDDDAPRTRGAAREAAQVAGDTAEELGLLLDDVKRCSDQSTWAFVACADLCAFAESLDPRGLREGPLRTAVLQLIPHVEAVELGAEGTRASRRSNQNFGYFNRMREQAWGW